jgi:hypothetical protein
LTDERIEPSPFPELAVLPDVLAVVLESCAPTGAAASTRPSAKSGVTRAAWRTRWELGGQYRVSRVKEQIRQVKPEGPQSPDQTVQPVDYRLKE